ncbi:hypothetical protein LP416_10210 [Polaromonas sp. P2-4]|nr:hypothetical protein LP416_10210 [Polaromonas sp. P2-4]
MLFLFHSRLLTTRALLMPKNPLPPDRHHELSEGWATTVQLLDGALKQRRFLRLLQEALGIDMTVSSLSPGPSNNVFVIPQPVEQILLAKLAIDSSDAWEAQLRSWGALTVNRLDRDVLFAVMHRGTEAQADGPLGGSKVSLVNTVAASRSADGTMLPKYFQGPHDWNLDVRGANVVAAWEMFANEPRFAAQLPWDGISIGHIDTGYT